MLLYILLFSILCGNLATGLASQANEIEGNEKIKTSKSATNFLILFADDLGYGDLSGVFGHPNSFTPNLMELGKRSKVFTNFYVASPVCSPSRYFYYHLYINIVFLKYN